MQPRALSISLCTLIFAFAFAMISMTDQRDAYADDQTVNTAEVHPFLKVNSKLHHQDSISHIFTFKVGFKGAVEFIQRLVEPVDRLNHHPALKITYNRVTVTLTTHDAGEPINLDLKLATIVKETFDQITDERGH